MTTFGSRWSNFHRLTDLPAYTCRDQDRPSAEHLYRCSGQEVRGVRNILPRHGHRSGYTAIGKLWPLNYEYSGVRVLRELFCHVKENLFPARTLILRAGNDMVKCRRCGPYESIVDRNHGVTSTRIFQCDWQTISMLIYTRSCLIYTVKSARLEQNCYYQLENTHCSERRRRDHNRIVNSLRLRFTKVNLWHVELRMWDERPQYMPIINCQQSCRKQWHKLN